MRSDALGFDPHGRFRTLVEPYRSEVQAHCYRMLGSLAEAEDATQEAMLRAWTGVDRLSDPHAARAWLYRVATNACIDLLGRLTRSEGRGAARIDRCPASFWEGIDAGPEAVISTRESVGLAFLVALHELPPRQRAVLLLCDVIGWSAVEVAALLEQTEASVNSALQRARARLARPRRSSPRLSGGASTRASLSRYIRAWEGRDALALTSLLRDDAKLTMPPGPIVVGRDAVRALLTPIFAELGEIRVLEVPVSGSAGLAAYHRARRETDFLPRALQVLEWTDGGIAALHTYLDAGLFPRFELPMRLSQPCREIDR